MLPEMSIFATICSWLQASWYQDVHRVLSETVTCQAMPRKVIASVENPAATSSTNEIEPIEPCRNSYSCTVEIESCQSFYDANTAREPAHGNSGGPVVVEAADHF